MIFLILFLLWSVNAQADDVFYNKKTSQVVMISDKSKVFLSDDDKAQLEIASLPSNFDQNTLTKPLNYYNFDGKNVVLNTQKIVDEDNAKVAVAKATQNAADLKASAMKKAIGLGFSQDELDAVFGK